MERIVEDHRTEGRTLSWAALGYEAGLDLKDPQGHTVKKAMGTMNYYMCIACKKNQVSPHLVKHQVEFAKIMKERYPDPEDWWNVRFFDEVHFSYSKDQTT